ncbi:CoA transferase [Actinophytocola sp.]|uniref:CaiB/BaiF CoA-transferase family protein n=1 Tax=Actinophytocola sp. TaxID=1872138 RepID=UPI003D6C347A
MDLGSYRVLDASHNSIGAALCAKVLAALGMRVTRIVRPDAPDPLRRLRPTIGSGDAAVSLPFQFLHADKAVVQLERGDRARRDELLADVDVIVQGAPGAELVEFVPAEVLAVAPSAVVVTITPLGVEVTTDVGDDFVAFHRSGLGYITPRALPGFPTGELPPLKPFSRMLEMLAAMQGVVACLSGLIGRRVSGLGDSVDISTVHSALPLVRREITAWLYDGEVATRGERIWKVAPAGIYQCRDGFVFLHVVEEGQWQRLCQLLDRPDLGADPQMATAVDRFTQPERLAAALDPWFAPLTVAEAVAKGQQAHVPIAPVARMPDLLADDSLWARSFFTKVPVVDREPVAMPRIPITWVGEGGDPASREPSRPPRPPADGKHRPPLAGYRIVAFTHVWAGPLCGQLLADLGADVIRVESHKRIDVHRTGGPYAGGVKGINRSGVWNSQNRGVRSCTINLATAEGVKLARRLVATADAVIENFSPGTLERIGLGFDVLRSVRPGIVLASLSAYGQSGAKRAHVGYGPMMDAASGMMAVAEYGDGIPRAVNGWAADIGGAMMGAVQILAALLDERRTEAVWADVSEYECAVVGQFEALLSYAADGQDVRPQGNRGPFGELTDCFETTLPDRWVAVSITEPDSLARVRDLLGLPTDTAGDEVMRALRNWVGGRQTEHVVAELSRLGVACGLVSTVHDLVVDPILTARNAFVDTRHAELGTISLYGPVWRFDRMPMATGAPAPCLGEHNREVFVGLLGVTDEELARFESAEVIF